MAYELRGVGLGSLGSTVSMNGGGARGSGGMTFVRGPCTSRGGTASSAQVAGGVEETCKDGTVWAPDGTGGVRQITSVGTTTAVDPWERSVTAVGAVIGLIGFVGGAYFGWKYGDERDHPILYAIGGSMAGSILGSAVSSTVAAVAL